MRFTKIPEAEEVLALMEPVIPHLYTSLEYGTNKAREYFDHERREQDRELRASDINRDLAPDIVRWHAKNYLQEVAAATGLFKVEFLSRNGLYIREFQEMEIRILKADDGGLPVPGSKSKEEFFRQMTMAVFEPVGLKLVALWDVDELYNLTPMKLACPRSSEPKHASEQKHALVTAHWYAPIPYVIPAETIGNGIATPDADDGLGAIYKAKKPELRANEKDKPKK